MIRIVLLFLAAMGAPAVYASCDPQAQIAESPPRDAWWLRIRFTPCDSEIYGIPVQKIDPSWRLASVNQLKHIPIPELQQQGLAFGKLHFELNGDFNRDGRPDRAAVGVYETTTGQTGRFMLIVTRIDTRAWRSVFVRLLPGKPGFFALERDKSKIVLWSCMDCDGVSEYGWNARTKKYTRLEPGKTEE
jgi:hypothetical protein